ncbi:MAG: hypothetical protein KAJ14_12765 [Candidatus Omnitrophica bacterium]|nr:hypothetical protein [Candidatus Omnitrophota bacterium]MCK5591702.1 hypothetical protein [Candidatus Paceibacterota bacterium]
MPNHFHGILIINNSIRQKGFLDFSWQRSFYDYVIRTNKSLQDIRQYIMNNASTWDNDEHNINSLKVQAGLNPTG